MKRINILILAVIILLLVGGFGSCQSKNEANQTGEIFTVEVITGITCKNEVNSSNTFNVSRIILHPDPDIDVALLQLSNNITYNNNRRAISYWGAMDDELYDIGNMVSVSGLGRLSPNGFDPTDCLQAVNANIISNQQAANMFNDPNMIVGGHEVATTGVGNIRQGACHGDSGGPLITMTETNEPVLIGVVSWGRSRCIGNNTNSPFVSRIKSTSF